MSINERVREVRKALEMSQAKFAKTLSMSNGYVAGIELGNNKVNDRIVKLICFTFHVSEKWLKTGEGEMFQGKSDMFAEFASATFKELKPVYQEYILKQIDQLLEIQNTEKDEMYTQEM